jgi:hypothetical protein
VLVKDEAKVAIRVGVVDRDRKSKGIREGDSGGAWAGGRGGEETYYFRLSVPCADGHAPVSGPFEEGVEGYLGSVPIGDGYGYVVGKEQRSQIDSDGFPNSDANDRVGVDVANEWLHKEDEE